MYCSNLGVPKRRNATDEKVKRGAVLFQEANCTACHVQTMTTGTNSKYKGLNNQRIYPFTDLLLHDMGDGLADGAEDYLANGNEWRTPPLWGIGMIETVNKHTFFLHDGRARNLEEAVLWHGGESEKSRDQFKSFNKTASSKLRALPSCKKNVCLFTVSIMPIPHKGGVLHSFPLAK